MRILVDLDDVVCDFIGGIFTLVGENPEDFMRRVPALNCCWRVTDSLNLPESLIWEMVDKQGYEFWIGLKPLPWYKILWEFLNERYKDNVFICTAPQPNVDCYKAKVDWIAKYLGTTKIILCPDKTIIDNKTSFLIDDNPYTVAHFKENGFLFPAINNAKRKIWKELLNNPEKVVSLFADVLK